MFYPRIFPSFYSAWGDCRGRLRSNPGVTPRRDELDCQDRWFPDSVVWRSHVRTILLSRPDEIQKNSTEQKTGWFFRYVRRWRCLCCRLDTLYRTHSGLNSDGRSILWSSRRRNHFIDFLFPGPGAAFFALGTAVSPILEYRQTPATSYAQD